MKQEDLQKIVKSLGKSGLTVAGDLVMHKEVQYEVNNVENGGIGIQINNGSKGTPMTASDKDIQAAIKELMEAMDEEGKLIFKNKKQWWAVYRVLNTFCNYPQKKSVFGTKMIDLGVAKVDGNRDYSYESLCAASDNVPLMATSSPATWEALKNLSDNYRQQYNVADFLMQKLGIKS